MKFLKRIIVAFVGILILAVIALAFTGHEFSPRPATSTKPYVATPVTKYISANGLKFGYISKGQGPLVLMFHGYPETAQTWEQVQNSIAEAGYQAVAIHMRGYAPTDGASEYSIASLGNDVVGLIDAFGANKAIIIGHDWGASAVYQAAYIEPEKIEKLIALSIPHPRGIEPSFLLNAKHFVYYQLPSAERLVWSYDFAHIDKIYHAWSPTFDAPQKVLDDVKASMMAPNGIKNALGYYRSFFAEGTDKAGPPAETTIDVPSLIIYGPNDGISDAAFDNAASAFTNGYHQVKLENVGHFPQIEVPERVSEEIIKFLNDSDY